MITKRDFCLSIQRSSELWTKLGILFVFKNPSSLNPSKNFLHTSKDSNSRYESIFLCGLQHGDYNIQLSDYSFFQFSITDEVECDYRIAYYPNPFALFDQSYLTELHDDLQSGLISYEEYAQLLSDFESNPKKPPLRYEYDSSLYRHLEHPTSHLHIGTFNHDRWPLGIYLTPYLFSLFVAKTYYFGEWSNEANITINEKNEKQNELDTHMIIEKEKSPQIPERLFSRIEQKQIYIG